MFPVEFLGNIETERAPEHDRPGRAALREIETGQIIFVNLTGSSSSNDVPMMVRTT